MVKIVRTLGFSFFFIIAILFLLPKTNLYYALEHKMQKYKIIVSNEEIIENAFSLQILDLSVSYKGIDLAEVAIMDTQLILFKNTLIFKDINLAAMTNAFLPSYIDKLSISYSIFNPFYLDIVASGEFGKANGTIHLLDKKVNIDLFSSDIMKKRYLNTLKLFHKNEQGVYRYEKTF